MLSPGPRRWAVCCLTTALMGTWSLAATGQTPVVMPNATELAPGEETVIADAARPLLPSDIQIVRFQGPPGVIVEVLGPAPEPVPIGDGHGLATFGLRVGVGYQLKLSNLPDRPGAELFPYIELLGHLHRPAEIDPGKYPIRIQLGIDDFTDVIDHGRMVTHVVYLEDPEEALPIHLPKDEIPIVTLSPAEHPLKVAAALGRVMAIVRMGNRAPTAEDLGGGTFFGANNGRCPFTVPGVGPCALPCGPVCGTPPPAGRSWLPKDEWLCDGGDFNEPAHFGGDGGLAGIDPRDAVVQFRDDRRPRVLPTNRVCIYAPRFASVRVGMGPNQALVVQNLVGAEQVERQVTSATRQGPRRMTQNQAAELGRHRNRASGLIARQGLGRHVEVKVLAASDAVSHIAGHVLTQGPEIKALGELPYAARTRLKLDAIKTGEGPIVTGIVEGAGEKVMAWKPQELATVEYPPNKPGLAVVKQVNVAEAEPGDVVTYTITYRNIGNVPITSVSIVDSLLPRLEYVPESSRGPAGAVFTAGENRAGSMELRWDIGTVAPGQQSAVSFQAKVR